MHGGGEKAAAKAKYRKWRGNGEEENQQWRMKIEEEKQRENQGRRVKSVIISNMWHQQYQ